MKKLDSYLTHAIQQLEPAYLVYCFTKEDGTEDWYIETPTDEIDIGPTFKSAKSALFGLITALKSRKSTSNPEI
jgi:hypothetical protein